MPWFQQLCRNMGLMIHHTLKPVKKSERQVLSKTVEEEQVDERITLRRTTIEEVEIRGKGTGGRRDEGTKEGA